MKTKNGRIYVCHTFYHVYVSFLKEFALGGEKKGNATMVLSLMSTDFGDIKDRIANSGYFKEVYEFDEKREFFFPELAKYKKDRGTILLNMIPRIIFTSKFAKLEEQFVPVDFSKYEEVYVFCDADPIGTYLNKKRIHYHAVEDGLNFIGRVVSAKRNNEGWFAIKKFLSMKLNLIFIQDGYSKYCDDIEVNNRSMVKDDFYKYKEVPRDELEKGITTDQKDTLVRVFVRDMDRMMEEVGHAAGGKDNIIILTEPLTTLDVREQIFRDLIEEYSKEGTVFLKIHPRDELDYEKLFPDTLKFDKKVPMEILNYFTSMHFKKVVSVFTELDNIRFADEKVYLGKHFMDKYEAPERHNFLIEE